jgi:hypothetical protein
MRRFSWPSRRSTGEFAARREPARRPTTRFRPRLELVERRDLLSTLTVTSADDSSASSLRGEINAAQSGDTIVFDPSLNGKTITLGGSQLEINKNLTIQGPGAGLLAINGGAFAGVQTRVFQVDAGANVTISGLTIEGGNGLSYYSNNNNVTPVPYDGGGGGILNLGTMTLSGCTVTRNNITVLYGTGDGVLFPSGGGIYNLGTMTLSGCTVSDNIPDLIQRSFFQGGGIYNLGTMTLSGCTVSDNSTYQPGTITGQGGGIYNDGTMTLSGCTVTGNTAYAGGGIFNDTQGHLTILSCVVQNNAARDGNGRDICDLGSMTISKDSKVSNISHK